MLDNTTETDIITQRFIAFPADKRKMAPLLTTIEPSSNTSQLAGSPEKIPITANPYAHLPATSSISDFHWPSVRSGLPVGADADRHVQRHGQIDGVFHGVAHQLTDLLALPRRDLKYEFVVDLQDDTALDT